MEVIEKQVKRVAKIWGVQGKKDVEYRLIKYSLSKKIDDGLLLHNMVSGELVLLNADEERLLNNLPSHYISEMDELIEKHFLVPVDYDECSNVDNLRQVLKIIEAKNNDKSITTYTILPTTACNARCFYCYEAGIETVTMNEETILDTVTFIENHHDGKKVELRWFGGEPTLRSDIISKICTLLKEKNIEFWSQMTTNGYLLNAEMVKQAKELWNLTNIQITLDGTEDIYNEVKNFCGVADSPYRTVLNNIKILIDNEIKVQVRLNIGKHNFENLFVLIDELYETFGRNKYFTVYLRVLFKPIDYSVDDEYVIEGIRKKLQDHIHEKFGFTVGEAMLPSLRLNFCMVDNVHTAMILPNGNLGKCPDVVDDNVGNIKTGYSHELLKSKWLDYTITGKCKDCFLYPNCHMLKSCPGGHKCNDFYFAKKVDEYTDAMFLTYDGYKSKLLNESR